MEHKTGAASINFEAGAGNGSYVVDAKMKLQNI